MKKYILVHDEKTNKFKLCRFDVDHEYIKTITKEDIEQIQGKGEPITTKKVPFDVMNSMKSNGGYSDLYFKLAYREKIEYIDSKLNGKTMCRPHGPRGDVEEDDAYDIQYYRYFIHPLIRIYDDLVNNDEFAITYHLKELLNYTKNGSELEKYYAHQLLYSLKIYSKDLNNSLRQVLIKLCVRLNYGIRLSRKNLEAQKKEKNSLDYSITLNDYKKLVKKKNYS